MAVEVPQTLEYRSGQLNAAPLLEDFQDSLDDEEDTRISQEYMDDLEEEYQARALLAKSKRKGHFHKPELRPTKDIKAKYNNVKAKLALLSSSALASKASMVKNKGLIAQAYEWDEEEVSSDDNEMVEVHTLLEMEDNDDRKNYLDYFTTLPSLKKLAGAEPVSEPKTIKSILKLNSTFKAEALKGVTINEPSSAPAKGSFFLEEESSQKNTQHVKKSYETCGSTVHTTTYHNDIEWFKRAKALQDKKVEALKSTKAESSDANKSKTPTKSVKSYLHKYVEPGPNVVFGDDSTCTTEGYGSIKCNGIVFTKVSFVNGLKYNLITISQLCDAKYIVQFDEKRGTIFNSNKEVVMIAPRIIYVYVLVMRSSAQESCFFAKAFENLNWLWHKRLDHLNFKTINQLTKENLVICLPSLVICLPSLVFFTWIYLDQDFSKLVLSLHTEQNDDAERKNKTLIEAARTMLSGSVFSKQYFTEAIATACYTQNRYTTVKKHLKTPYEIFRKRITSIDFLYVFGCPIYIHNHKDHLGKFDEKANDGTSLDTHLFPKPLKSSTLEDNKLKKPITSLLMKSLMLSNS
ncbi:retrovirus-related pol polyprotein from transposon TNT 1-94 [Tanacetum coccineum]